MITDMCSTNTRSQVIKKLNNAGFSASINSDGKIEIFKSGVSNLSVSSDTSGFAEFYGLGSSEKTYSGQINTTTETVTNPDPVDPDNPTDPDDGNDGDDTDGTDNDNPPFNIDGLITSGVSNIRLQIGTDSSEYYALYCDTTFLFDEFSLDFSSEDSCADSIDLLDALSKAINSKISDIGVYSSRLETIYTSNTMKIENTYSAYSTVMDADIAQETEKYIKYQIKQQTASSLLAQIQAARSQMILSLIGSIM